MKKYNLILYCLCLFGIKLHAQNIYIESNAVLYTTGTAVVDGATSASPTLYSVGTIQNTGTLQNEGEIQITGDLSSSGIFTSIGDEVFIGNSAQSVSGNLINTNSLNNLVVDKILNSLSLNTGADVNGQVNLVNGKVVLGSNDLKVSGNIIGYDIVDYIMTNSTGSLKQIVAASNVIFPVGNSAYNPVTINNTGVSDVFSARVGDGVGCQGGNGLGISNKVDRTWYLGEATPGGSLSTITTQWNVGEEGSTFVRANSGIADYDGTYFNLAALNSAANAISSSVYSQTQTGQTSISPRIVTSVDTVAVLGNTTFCAGGSVILQSPTHPSYAYQWNKDGVPIPGANALFYTATTSGQYNVSITVNGTCVMKTAPITVTELAAAPAPTIAFSSPASGNSSLTACDGTQIILSSPTSNVNEYIWYRNGSIINYALSPTNNYLLNASGNGTDVYTLVVTYNGMQCLSAPSNTLSVVKISPISVITLAGPATFCASNPTTLNANAGMTNYVWKRSTTTVQSGASNSYIPTVTGNHNVTVTDANGCSKTSLWKNIIIKPLPIANAGPDKNVCEGTSVQIGSTNNVANTYTWSPAIGLSNGFISNPMAATSGITTYTLTVNNASTGCTNSDAVVVTSLSAPATPSLANTATPVCQGATISITPTTVGATSVNWYKNGVLLYNKPTSFIQSVSLPTAAAETYTIKAKGANTCLSGISNPVNAWIKEATVPTITSTPAAVGNLITVCVPGGTTGNATLTASSTTPSPSYSWKLANAYIPGANTNNFVATVTTTQNNKVFSVQATYPNGCVKTSVAKTVKLLTSGCTPKLGSGKDGDLTEIVFDTEYLSAYPNPTNGVLNVSIANSEASEGKLILYNTLGQSIWEKDILLSDGKADVQIDLSNEAIGVYSLIFHTDSGEEVKKIVKE